MSEKFRVPSESEVKEYGLSIGYRIRADKFLAHYEARGWMMGKTKIKSWKACVKTWMIKSAEDGAGDVFKPVAKESDEDKKKRLIQSGRCVYCTYGKLEWNEERQEWRCRSCNIDNTKLKEKYGDKTIKERQMDFFNGSLPTKA